ncbi:hypothetical protein BCIN_09g05990 [Botrytis cinerea B05.10]|uniref:Uncharacterized protein n=1 Tax=Botryotinia fuckeliana (strain B05.10) TaxID=332648 RepID=A0A384JTB5_BOTFB|nr:hypothetical protein BCIN_09g05990 [Botrytis cinerea B05.10]ATZ53828.1 hypothetical protein BCIN_09g05990 [Botrytis cinerea B05.10]
MSAVDGIVSFFVCMDEECERMREIEAEGYTTCAEKEEQGKEKTKDKCGHEEWEVIMSVDIPNRENILLVPSSCSSEFMKFTHDSSLLHAA